MLLAAGQEEQRALSQNVGSSAAVVAGGGYTVGNWEFGAQSRWQSWFIDYSANTTTTFLQPAKVDHDILADARAAYRISNVVTVGLTAQQLNVPRLTVSAGPPIQRRVFLSFTVHL